MTGCGLHIRLSGSDDVEAPVLTNGRGYAADARGDVLRGAD
jgi:hypothetical protein